MKTILAALLVSFVSFGVFADEVVDLKGSLAIGRCVDTPNGQGMCSVTAVIAQPFQITLTPSVNSDPNALSGDHKIVKFSDGYQFEALITVFKSSSGNYDVQVILTSQKINDKSTLKSANLGAVTVDDLTYLNNVEFRGEEIKDGNLTLSPSVFVSSAN